MSTFTLASLLCGISALILTIFSLIFSKTKAQKLFTLFNVAVTVWGFGNFFVGISPDSSSAVLAWPIAYAGGIFTGPIFYHLANLLAAREKTRMAVWFGYGHALLVLLTVLFCPKLVVSETHLAYGVNYSTLTPFLTTSIGVFLVYVVLSYKELWAWRVKSQGQDRARANYLLAGFAFGFFGAITTLLPTFGVEWIYPVGNIGTSFYLLVIAYAIFRHHLLDIRVVIRKTLFYSLLTVAISFIYVFLIFLIQNIFLRQVVSGSYWMTSLAVLLVAMILLKPIEIALTRILDRKFFKGTIGQIAEQKAQLETELERRERLKSVGILAAGMAHEIKNPLTAINTFAEYLPTKFDDPEFRRKFSKIIPQEVARMKGIVTSLLQFSKPAEPDRRPCNLNDTIREILELLSSDFLKHHIQVETTLEDHQVLVDPSQIKQALLNIIMNAVDAMKDKGGLLKIDCRQQTTDRRLEISISDAGPGIPSDKIKRIFDPFYSDKDGGTGLGLAITHSIIEKNGGKIAVESQLGLGTRFTILLSLL